jgi:hypothetical protein
LIIHPVILISSILVLAQVTRSVRKKVS